jgi:thiamine pyrophosphate-dependent acetolactate synthase large subunit-like protein
MELMYPKWDTEEAVDKVHLIEWFYIYIKLIHFQSAETIVDTQMQIENLQEVLKSLRAEHKMVILSWVWYKCRLIEALQMVERICEAISCPVCFEPFTRPVV